MKKIILSVVAVLIAIATIHANDNSKSYLISQVKIASIRADSAYKAKDYDLGIKILESYLKMYRSYPKSLRDSMPYIEANRGYDLATLYGAKGNKGKALEWFTRAIDFGYSDYYSILNNKNLDIIRDDSLYQDLMKPLKESNDFLHVLQQSNGYYSEPTLPSLSYASSSDPDLIKLRKYLNLDSVAGNGDEISKIKNITAFVHNLIIHDGNSQFPPYKNMIEMIEICHKQKRGATCRIMATLLNECFLSMGFPSKFVTCLPKVYVSDCHVINAVWSQSLNKWLWMDPSFNAYIMDANNNLLSIEEVREALRENKPLKTNSDINWNNKKIDKSYYLDYYMAKNLYLIEACDYYGYNTEKGKPKYITLAPLNTVKANEIEGMNTDYLTSNNRYFWQAPK